jgi:hypothetical protein
MSPERTGGVWTEEPATREDIAFERPRGAERSEAVGRARTGGVWTEEPATREDIAFERLRGAERSEAQ